MSDRIGLLRNAWRVLSAGPRQAQSVSVYAMEEEPRMIRAVITAAGHRGLLVGIADDERVAVPLHMQPDVSAALQGEVAFFDVPGAGQLRFLHVWCRDRLADQAFEAFCALLWRAAETDALSVALRQCSDEFRRLLLAEREPVPNSAVGLLGELIVLRRLVERDPRLISAWTGPSGARHDFRRGSAAVETKTTVRSEARGRTVRIADIDQLEPPEGGTLYLYLVRLEQAMSGKLSLASVVDQIMARLESAEADAFRRLVAEMHDGRNWDAPFELREELAYEVRDGFPSLTSAKLAKGQLDAGVSRVGYDLALESAAAFEVATAAAIDSLCGAS